MFVGLVDSAVSRRSVAISQDTKVRILKMRSKRKPETRPKVKCVICLSSQGAANTGMGDPSPLQKATPAVTVSIVSFNQCHNPNARLDALRKQSLLPYEVIVRDNASSDGSIEWLRGNAPDVTIIANSETLGTLRDITARSISLKQGTDWP